MSDFGRIDPRELDRYITGNYGEDQFRSRRTTPKRRRMKELWQRLVAEQEKWVAEHGGDLAGYVANYHEKHGRTLENAEAIYNADMSELTRRRQRLAAL